MMSPKKEDFIRIIAMNDDLGCHGFRRDTQSYADFDVSRDKIYDDPDKEEYKGFLSACEWLSKCKIIKTVNTTVTTATLKMIATSDTGVKISNGAFIVAVIYLKIPYKRYSYMQSICIAISSKQF